VPPPRRAGSVPDLFASAAERALASTAPLAARLRPRTLDEFVGQKALVGPGGPLRALIEADRISSAVLWGPPGTGKTSLARIVATRSARHFEALSAVTAGVKDVRDVLEAARRRLGTEGSGTILFLDEVHRFNKAQQDALLPGVEEGIIVLIGATTENPFFSLNAPLLSRSTLWRFEALSTEELTELAYRAIDHEGAEAEPGAVARVVDLAEGDARAVLTTIEVAIALAQARSTIDKARETAPAEPARPGGEAGRDRATDAAPERVILTVADIEAARTTRAIRHGRDEHYDIVSGFIKSIRGSDPDAGLYWLARLVAAGEDPRFLARRLVILASEDVGMADPSALVVADAAARAVEFVGMPEAGLNLAQAVVHLACAPKSNRSATAWWRAQEDVRDRPAGSVPVQLRDASYASAATIGHGVGYEYPHDQPGAWVPTEYRPPEVAGRSYYEPSDHGAEHDVALRLQELRRRTKAASEDARWREQDVTRVTKGDGTC
jgi:putative ATPase